MEMKGMMGGFYRISEWIMRLSAINLLWIICSLPVVALLFLQMLYISQQPDVVYETLYQVVVSLSLPLVLAPFTFFPATSAMFSVARKWATGEGDIPLFKSYFSYFKSNYKQAMLGGLFFEVAFVVMVINIQFYSDQPGWLGALNFIFLFFLIILTGVCFNFFCYLAHFEMPLGSMIKNSILFTIARPINTVYILVMNAAIVYISLFQFTFLIPFFMGSIIALVTYWGFNRSITKIQEKAEQQEKSSSEAEG